MVTKGFATEILGSYGAVWAFFGDLEPALAFGRAARMSWDSSAFGVHDAFHDKQFDANLGRDITTLLVDRDPAHRTRPDEREVLLRWVDGCWSKSSYFCPPERRW